MYCAKLALGLGPFLFYVACISAYPAPMESSGNQEIGQAHALLRQAVVGSSVAHINVAATNKCKVYLNGVKIVSTNSYAEHGTVERRVKNGDVIAVEASHKKGWGGVIVDIDIGSRHYRTGHEEFKVRLASQVSGAQNAWKIPGFSSCSWNMPVPMPRPDTDVFSKTFPYQSGAMYVWASSRGEEDVYLRFVVGGENCVSTLLQNSGGLSAPSPRLALSPSPVEGGSDCGCIEQANDLVGDCYEFTGEKRGNKRICRRRDCQAKFVCVENGVESNTRCVRRYATHELRQVGKYSGKLVCLEEELETAKPFYVPYA